MKTKFFSLILALFFLLCGCEKAPVETEVTAAQTLPIQALPTQSPPPAATEASLEATARSPAPEDFVRVLDYIPSARQALMYATDRNFTGQVIYDFSDAWLRYGTVKKLMAVSEDLAQLGLSLQLWDGFRPVSAQWRLWEACPNPAFLANPKTGFSSHSRGNTVDITLVDADGKELEMPTGFDDFSAKADRNYSDCTETAAAHAELLEILMEKHGFRGYSGEWWHYSDTDEYPVEERFSPS